MKKRLYIALVGGISALSLAGCATKQKARVGVIPGVAPQATISSTETAIPSGRMVENFVTATATVEKIDLTTRMVTLKGAGGKLVTFKADERVKNLPQVKVGDEVIVTYYEAIAVKVLKPGETEPSVSLAEDVGTAKPGEKPAGVAAREITITATIEAIDKPTSSVTLKGPEGNSVTVKVRNPQRLEKVQVGDMVEITYTEAVAIAVEPAAKK